MTKQGTLTFQELYPHLTDREAEVAENNLKSYLAIVSRILERMEHQNKSEDC